jgi:hypothetical protein
MDLLCLTLLRRYGQSKNVMLYLLTSFSIKRRFEKIRFTARSKGDVELSAFLTAQNLKHFIPEELKVTSS